MALPASVGNLPVIGPWLTMQDYNQNQVPAQQIAQASQAQMLSNAMQAHQQAAITNPLQAKILGAQAQQADLMFALKKAALQAQGLIPPDAGGTAGSAASGGMQQTPTAAPVQGMQPNPAASTNGLTGQFNGMGGIPADLARELQIAELTGIGKEAAKAKVTAYLQSVKPMSTRNGIYNVDPNNPGHYQMAGGALPSGTLPVTFGPNGPSVAALPGQIETGAQIAAANAGAVAGSRAPFETVEVTLGDGRQVRIPKSMLPGIGTPVGSQPATAPVQQAPQFSTAPTEAAALQKLSSGAPQDITIQPNAASTQSVPSLANQGIPVAARAAQVASEEELAKEAKGNRDAANIAVDANYGLQHILQDADTFAPGRYTNTVMGLKGAIQGVFPGLISGDELNKIASFQDFNKWATKLGFDQARKMGARESTQIVQMAIQSNPNAEQVKPALVSVAHGLLAQNDYVIAKAKFQDQWAAAHNGTLQGFNSAWQDMADPRAFLLRYQTPEEQKNLLGTLDGAGRTKLLNNLKTLRAAGIL